MAEPQPFIANDVCIDVDGVDMKCLTNHIEVSPDVSTETATTFCGVVDYPGAVKWQFIATFYQSFDADGTFQLLQRIVSAGAPVPVTIVPNCSKPVGPTNPEITFEVVPQPYPIISADAGALSTVEITWSIVGEPTFSETDTRGITRASGTGTTPSTPPATVAA